MLFREDTAKIIAANIKIRAAQNLNKMNDRQKRLIKFGYIIIFLLFFYIIIRLLVPSLDFFIISIILLGLLFFNTFIEIVIIEPIIEDTGIIKGKIIMLDQFKKDFKLLNKKLKKKK